MVFPIEEKYRAAILRQYEKRLARFPAVKAEADAYLAEKEEPFRLCLQYLYAHMPAQDLLSLPVQTAAEYVHATLEAFRLLDHIQSVPPELFFPYVLHHRVNSEQADGSRGYLLQQLLPYVQGRSMVQAARNVNYWCYAHATYTPSDDRTLGPLAILNRTQGRCGEESVLAVSALRSVGIPARQCYCPRWSHCDDNHAWVEFWADGRWHYMGACEPEPVPDRGWFTAAASRAMRVDTKCWADWEEDGLYKAVSCTARYAPTRVLTVQVTRDGAPVPGAVVQFQTVNYSELYTLFRTETDEAGLVRFETGLGDLFVHARHGQTAALAKADLRRCDQLVLALESRLPQQLEADLVPPADSSALVPYAADEVHEAHLRQCEAHLAQHRSAFAGESGYWQLTAGNREQLRRFWEDPRFSRESKESLLSTLRPKDFADITCQTLTDALETSLPAARRWPEEIFRSYILAPRVADEMLLPERQKLRRLFPGGFDHPGGILAWMETNMQYLPDEGITIFYPSAYGCLRFRQVPQFAFDGVFVALCRAFGFPARLEEATGQAQWLDEALRWHPIRPQTQTVELTLEAPAGSRLHYFEHFTLSRREADDFVTLQYPELVLEGSHTFRLQPGFYRIAVTTRQLDGTASIRLHHLQLTGSTRLKLQPPEDQTAQRLRKIPLSLPDGPLNRLLRTSRQDTLLIFADPGSEPTEHLLRELAQCADDFSRLPTRILLAVQTPQAAAHPSLQHLPGAQVHCLQDTGALAALHRQLQVGDLRLPFAVCIDRCGNGIHAEANYRIRMAATLLQIHRLLAADPS